jgi:hypothetical protein
MNKGINLEREKLEQSLEDWVLGGVGPDLKCLATIPLSSVVFYLPLGEKQFGKEDFMDCASRGPNNILETKLNYLYRTKQLPDQQWFKDKGYITSRGFELSDRFTAILSNTTRQGNSLKSPLEAIRKNGCIPKIMLPANPQMTFDEYHNPQSITSEMMSMGQEFLKRLSINYEKVYKGQFDVFYDVLNVAGFAWEMPINDIFPPSDNPPNHVWMNWNLPKYTAFDNYIDQVDGDYIKRLSTDFNFFDYGYRIIISLTPPKQYENILLKFLEILKGYISILSKKVKGNKS